jgi:hypothetical protein
LFFDASFELLSLRDRAIESENGQRIRPATKMASHHGRNSAQMREKEGKFDNAGEFNEQDDDEDEEEEYEDTYEPVDRIRRSFRLTSQQSNSSQQQQQYNVAGKQAGQQQSYKLPTVETIQVTLNESYFARERRFIVNQLANARQKLNSIQLFNPAQNESLKQQQQQQWSEKVSSIRLAAPI